MHWPLQYNGNTVKRGISHTVNQNIYYYTLQDKLRYNYFFTLDRPTMEKARIEIKKQRRSSQALVNLQLFTTKPQNFIHVLVLTLSQTTNFTTFQTERVCRRQF